VQKEDLLIGMRREGEYLLQEGSESRKVGFIILKRPWGAKNQKPRKNFPREGISKQKMVSLEKRISGKRHFPIDKNQRGGSLRKSTKVGVGTPEKTWRKRVSAKGCPH